MTNARVRFALAGLLLAGCSGRGHLGGAFSDATGARAVAVGAFTEIETGGAVTLTAGTGSGPSVQLSGNAERVNSATVEVSGGKLLIKEGDGIHHGELNAEVHAPTITAVSLSGASTATVSGLSGAQVTLAASGASRIEVRGSCQQLVVRASGASAIKALAMAAERVDVQANGASHAEVQAQKELDAVASGASSIRYAGAPVMVKKDASGASSIDSE